MDHPKNTVSVLLSTLLAVLPLLCACDATTKREVPAVYRQAEPDHPNNAWIGANIAELMELHGEPADVIDATLLGRPRSEAYVYPSLQGDGCLDTFVVVVGTGEIIDYFCR